MSIVDEPCEIDDRLPCGEWIGFYVQPDGRRRHAMELVLQFEQAQISGRGGDSIGEFTISGEYDTDIVACRWTKQYVGRHGVEYAGQAREGGIIGQWRIPGQPEFWSGPFFIWPRASGNLESAFERAFLEYELTSQLVNDPAS